ncbi:MarR family transcriptional regulator [Frondihabitans australicus]|uniref:DNA-binding MarR family transcriptional regulator n=1 Tax=Frondihabitans australicus TaxID=386892 RepID=A0A495IF40_9MICO|nr:MarR family transcriptional regulator [Frondihabitans australicus]RKR73961.1 DNA-binding MarR family transcriptional regulator [Frondihabitans australicus]
MSTDSAAATGVLDVGADSAAARLALVVGRLNRLLRPSRSQLSPGLMMALSTIARQGPLRPSQLGRVEGVSAPSATRIIDELVRRDLAEKAPDPDDGRSFFVRATTAGEQAVLDARRERAEYAGALLDGLTDEESRLLLAALPALEHAAEGDLV